MILEIFLNAPRLNVRKIIQPNLNDFVLFKKIQLVTKFQYVLSNLDF